jgi:hypothetical protein
VSDQTPLEGSARLIVLATAVAGGVLLVVAQLLQPLGSDASNAELLASMHDHHSAWAISTALFYPAALLLLGSVGAVLAHNWHAWPRMARSGALLLTLTFTASIALTTLTLVEVAMARDGADRGAMLAAVDRLTDSNPTSTAIIVSFLAGLVLGTIMLAVASWRARLAPRATTICLVLGGIGDFAAETRATEAIALALLAIGIVGLALGQGHGTREPFPSGQALTAKSA